MNAYDVAVIGGGPAGCSTAIRLARQGARVVLFEARQYPHDKLCGEFLSPECLPLLAELGLGPALARLAPPPVQGVRITTPAGAEWGAPLPGLGACLSRKRLDAALAEQAQAAGVDLRPGTTVTALDGSLTDGFRLETRRAGGRVETVLARAAVAAYGKRSALDRALGRPFMQHAQPFVALKAHFHGPPLPGRVELHAFPGGYCGLSDIEDGASVVCLLAHRSAFEHGRIDPRQPPAGAFIEWMKRQNPRLMDWLSQAERIHPAWISIAQVPFTPKTTNVGDLLMAGDTAGLIVPLAGNGISIALESGGLAAQALSGYFSGRRDPAGAVSDYAKSWTAAFSSRLRIGRWLQPLMLRPSALSTALRLFNAFPPLGRWLVTHTRGPAS